MHLKDVLRQIESDSRDSFQIRDRLAHGWVPSDRGCDNIHLGTLDVVGAPVHPHCNRQPDPPVEYEAKLVVMRASVR